MAGVLMGPLQCYAYRCRTDVARVERISCEQGLFISPATLQGFKSKSSAVVTPVVPNLCVCVCVCVCMCVCKCVCVLLDCTSVMHALAKTTLGGVEC